LVSTYTWPGATGLALATAAGANAHAIVTRAANRIRGRIPQQFFMSNLSVE
jgi:hypothetical protein